VSAVLYILIIFTFTAGWNSLRSYSFTHRNPKTSLSVVVAFRNEINFLQKLLEALSQQTYPNTLLELIFVNDHSTDESKTVIEEFIAANKTLDIRLLDSDGKGKKAALHKGITSASGTLIVTTDADCLPKKGWLAEIAVLYEEKHPRLILGPVIYDREKSFLQKLFSLDFISLVASGAGSAEIGLPFMGNAANMAFEKQIYVDAEKDALNTGFASGDDVFFIHYVRREFGRKAIAFIKNEETIVRTPPPENLNAFLLQRIRWGSKARAYSQPWALAVSYTIFLFNFLLTAILISSLFVHHWLVVIYLLFILLKTLTDFPLLYAFGRFSGKRNLLPLIFPFEIVYPVYITYVALRGLFPYEWKERKIDR
jgi:cellulose synthase/poly-beta-1,6-N-acetylglucosamine synthase-like glycosyltransferase